MDQQPTRYINQSLRILSATLLLLVASVSFAGSHFLLPENHQSTYSVSKYGAEVAEIKSNFQYKNQQINYTSVATATGVTAMFFKEVITETSLLFWPENESLQSPQQTSYVLRHKKKSKKNQEIKFHWAETDHVDITSTYRKKVSTVSSNQQAWSSQLIPILMSNNLLHDKNTTKNSFLIANKGRLVNYNYQFEGKENITLDNKIQPCVKYKIRKQDSDRFSYVWLSEDYFYLPLKIEQYKGDELNVSMMLKHFKLLQ